MKTKFLLYSIIPFFLIGCSTPLDKIESRAAEMTDQEVVDFLRNTRIAVCSWRGMNKWNRSETGFSGGRGHACEFIKVNDSQDYTLFCQLFTSTEDNRIYKNPRILFPLFESNNPEDVLIAFYCYRQSMPSGLYDRDGNNYGPDSDLAMTFKIYRKLLKENRDVRVRYLAAQALRGGMAFELEDVDTMLSDPSLAVRCIGTDVVSNVISMIGGKAKFSRYKATIGLSKKINSEDFTEVKKVLGDILLKHIDDHHFDIRARCLGSYYALIKRMVPAPTGDGLYQEVVPMPDYMKFSIRYQNWLQVHEMKKKLIPWWNVNKDDIVRNYGPDWKPGNKNNH